MALNLQDIPPPVETQRSVQYPTPGLNHQNLLKVKAYVAVNLEDILPVETQRSVYF